MKWNLRLIGLFLVLVLAMVACGGDDDEASLSSGSSDSARSNNAQTGSETQETNVSDLTGWNLEPIEGLEDDLVFVQGRTLYMTHFDGDEPTMIAEEIFPPTLGISPDGTSITYNDLLSRTDRFMTLASLETLESVQLVDSQGDFGGFGAWSPNGEWAFVFSFPRFFVAKVDGTQTYSMESFQNQNLITFWLTDNTVLLIVQNNNTNVNFVRRFDPEADEDIEITEDNQQALIEAWNAASAFRAPLDDGLHFQQLVAELLGEPLVFAVDLEAENPPAINVIGPPPPAPGGGGGAPQLCVDWEIQRQEIALGVDPETVYVARDTLFISNLSVLDDGTLIFLRWYFPECGQRNHVANVMRITPDGTAEVLADAVDPSTSQNYGFFFGDVGAHLSVSTDGQFAVWIGGGLDAGETTLNLINLETNETTIIAREVRNVANSSTFHLDTMFTSVLFVPGD